ncbi:MAG: hypothetical protein KGM96_05620 [Acidobacteriota bacterium]|nr:hypothetical protein [Acidobacteriota bacterium]
MRYSTSCTALILLAALAAPAGAYCSDETAPDQQSIAALEARVDQAPAREQCFLYAELIHQMTEFSLRQYAAGDVAKSTAMLKQIQQLANKVHVSLADDNKRLKNAEILLRHAAFHLREMLHSSSYEDRPLVEQTLAQVNQADNDAMMQVFRK